MAMLNNQMVSNFGGKNWLNSFGERRMGSLEATSFGKTIIKYHKPIPNFTISGIKPFPNGWFILLSSHYTKWSCWFDVNLIPSRFFRVATADATARKRQGSLRPLHQRPQGWDSKHVQMCMNSNAWINNRVTTSQNSILSQTITWFHNVWTLMLKMLVQFIRWSGMMWNIDKRNRFTMVYTHHMKLHFKWACLNSGSPTLFKKHAKLQRSRTSWSRQRWNPTLVTLRQLTLAHRQIQR